MTRLAPQILRVIRRCGGVRRSRTPLALAIAFAATGFGAWMPPAAAQDLPMESGSYTGSGSGLILNTMSGFAPSVVIVKGDLDEPTIIRTVTMPGTMSKRLGENGDPPPDAIVGLSGTSIGIGTNPAVNQAGDRYVWTALAAAPGRLAVGTYDGDGSPDRTIGGLGFPPGYVIVLAGDANPAVQRFPAQPLGESVPFGNTAEHPDAILSFEGDGFRIGSHSSVNDPGVTYHWIAVADFGGAFASGVYTGNGNDWHHIDDSGFEPEFVFIKTPQSGDPAVLRSTAFGSNESAEANQGTFRAEALKSFSSSGFYLGNGNDNSVNRDGRDYYWASLRGAVWNPDLEVTGWAVPPVAAEGDTVAVHFRVENVGSAILDDCWLQTARSGLDYVTNSRTQGTYYSILKSWLIGTLAPGAHAEITLVYVVQEGTEGTVLTVTGSRSWSAPEDVHPENDTADVEISIPLAGSAELALTKTVDDSLHAVGQTALFTILVENFGPEVATGVDVKDLLPPGLTYSFDTPSQGTYDGIAGVWSFGSLAPGDTASLSLAAKVDADTEGQTLWNVASLSGFDQPDPNPGNDVDSAAVVVPVADLRIALSVTNPDPIEGDTMDVVVSLQSDGPHPARNVVIDALLPAGLSYASDVATTGSYGEVDGTWIIPEIAPGAGQTLVLTATVDSGTAGSGIAVYAGVSESEAFDPDLSNDADTTGFWVQSANLEIVKTVDVADPVEGEVVRFDLDVENFGPDDAFGVSVLDLLPAGMTYVSDTIDVGGYDSETGIWNVGSLIPGQSERLRIFARIDSGTAGLTLTNSAQVSSVGPGDPDVANDSSAVDVTVQSADLRITKVASDPFPNEGDAIIWTVTLENLGPQRATNATVLDSLPAGLTWLADTPSIGTYDTSTGVWDLGDIDPGSIETLAILTRVDAGTGGTLITNTATAVSPDIADPVAANDTMSVAVDVPLVDLAVTKTVSRPNPSPGQTVNWTIRLSNAGPDTATGIAVTDTIPGGVMFLNAVPDRGHWVDSTSTWNVDALAPGDSLDLVLSTSVDGGAGGMHIVNTAIASADETDSNATNDVGSAFIDVSNIVVIERADLSLSASVDDGTPRVGDPVQWTVSLTNQGPDPSTGSEVAAALPEGLEFVNANATLGGYDLPSGTWTPGALANGQVVTLVIDAIAAAGQGGMTIPLTAAVTSAGQADVDNTDNSASTNVRVEAANLGLASLVNVSDPDEGDTVAFGVLVTNAGPDAADGVAVSAGGPPGFTIVSTNASAGAYDSTSGVWSIGPTSPGDSLVLTIAGTIDEGTGGTTLLHSAAITTSDQEDPDPSDDTSSISVTVRTADLVVSKSSSVGLAQPGDAVEFAIRVVNDGPDSSRSAALVDSLPVGLTLLSAVPERGEFHDSTGVWDVGDLAPADTAVLVMSTIVDPGTGGSTLRNVARVGDIVTHDGDGSNDADSAAVTILLPTGFTITGTQPSTIVRPGESFAHLMSLAIASSYDQPKTLQSLAFTNSSSGPGTPGELDGEFGGVSLWLDNGDGVFRSRDDTQIDLVGASGGEVGFTGIDISIPSGGTLVLHVAADPTTKARDGDVLDLLLADESAVAISSSPPILNPWPVDPAGGLTVDGLAAASLSLTKVASGPIWAGASDVLGFGIDVSRNGYEDDVLEEIRVVNFGDADPGDLDAVRLWLDGGNGTFDAGAVDDVSLGIATENGGFWERTGLAIPLDATGARVWISMDVSAGATLGGTFRLGILSPSETGLVMASDNDGPADAEMANSGTMTIQAPPATIEIVADPQTEGALRPGEEADGILEIHLINPSAAAETLQTLTITNTTVGQGSIEQLDANWQTLSLLDRSVSVTGSGGVDDESGPNLPTAQTTATFSGGIATFSDLQIIVAANDTTSLTVESGASLIARDGDDLDVAVSSVDDLTFSRAVAYSSNFPIDPPGSYEVDGSTASQFKVSEPAERNLLTGSIRNPALAVTIPSNGYEPDVLTRLDVVNLGTALPEVDLVKLEAWGDDGDGVFDAAVDDSLGTLVYTGDRWELTGVAATIPAPGGLHIHVTTDVADLAEVSRRVRLAIPGAPDPGMGVQSTNDGPLDEAVASPVFQSITTSDRVTLSAAPIDSGTVAPGATDVPVLRLSWENTYSETKRLTGLEIANATTGAGLPSDFDLEASRVVVRADDENGAILGTASFSNGFATVLALDHDLPAGMTGDLLVSMDLSLENARDGDALGVRIADALSVTFAGPTSIAAEWPLDSEGRMIVDGMIAAQIENVGTPTATLGPNEGPVLAFDLVLPGNGYSTDVLRSLTLENVGSAESGDFAEVRLWQDGGNFAFDAGIGAGDDQDRGLLFPDGDRWSSSLFTSPIASGGSRFFVSVTTSSSPTDSSTLRMRLPIDGIGMESTNDGPIDAAIVNDVEILLSTASLLASFAIEPAASTIGQTITSRLTVRNDSDSTIVNVTPDPPTASGLGSLELLSGPSPPSYDMAPDELREFEWTWRAASSEAVWLTTAVSGVEAGTSLPRRSLPAVSNVHQIFVEADEAQLWAVESMPFSISRGQTDVVPLSLTIANVGGSGGSAVKVTGLRMRLLDGNSLGIVPSDLLSRIVVKEGSEIYADKSSTIETSGDEVFLAFDPANPLLIDSADGPDDPASISLAIDVSDSAGVSDFRLRLESASAVSVEDENSGAPVTVALQEGSWPIESGLARIVAEATELRIAGEPDSAKSAARGQEDVLLLALNVENFDAQGLASDIRLAGFDVEFVDETGGAILDPSACLTAIEVRGPLGVPLLQRDLGGAADDSTVTLDLTDPLSCPVNQPVRLEVRGDLSGAAPLGNFRMQLADSASVEARDANTNAPVAVPLATTPILGSVVTVEAAANTLAAAATSMFPPAIPVGQRDVSPMQVTLTHPGTAGTGPIRCDGLTWRLRDDRGAPLVPAAHLDRVRVMRGAAEVGAAVGLPTSGDALTVPLTGVTIEAESSVTLTVWVDVEATAPSGFFEMLLPEAGIDAQDVNRSLPVAVVPSTGSFPFSSGITQLQAPARQLAVGFVGSVPPVLAGDGSEIPVGTWTFTNDAVAPAGIVRVATLTLRASDRDGAEFPIGAVATSLTARIGEAIVGESGPLDPLDGKAAIAFADTLSLEPESPAEITLTATLRARPDVSSVRFGIEEGDVGVVQPGSELLSVAVQAAPGQAFPFWTLAGSFSETTLEESWSNFPNPFAAGRDETTFAFYLPEEGRVTVRLWTVRGEPILTILDGAPLGAGLHQDAVWDGRNGKGEVVRNGAYLAEISVDWSSGGSARHLRKVAVVR